jgi:hypothetical protein
MVSDPDVGEIGGNLVFRARRPITADIHLDAEGAVSRATGDATVTGTPTCSRRTNQCHVDVFLRQRINDTDLALGSGSAGGNGVCKPTSPVRFSVLIEPSDTILFKAGNPGVQFVGSVRVEGEKCGHTTWHRNLVVLRWVT